MRPFDELTTEDFQYVALSTLTAAEKKRLGAPHTVLVNVSTLRTS